MTHTRRHPINNPEVDIRDHIPLREPTFYILLSLASEPRHGYAIMKDIAELSEERVTLSTSTLYTALKRLLEQEWITREEDPDPEESNRVRKFYRLTPLGSRVLNADIRRLERKVSFARERMLGENP